MNDEHEWLPEIVESVWESTLGLQAELGDCDNTGACETHEVRIRVRIDGANPSVFALACSEEMARAAAAKTFHVEPAEATLEDLDDAVAELVNMIAGNARGFFPGTVLGLPEVAAREERRLAHTSPGCHFVCEGMPFHVFVDTPQDPGAEPGAEVEPEPGE